MSIMIRYSDGVCDEKGESIAIRAKGWWYEPKLNKFGLIEMEACTKDKFKEYASMPITAEKVQSIVSIRKHEGKHERIPS